MAQPINIVVQGKDDTQRAFTSLAQNLAVMSTAIDASVGELAKLSSGIEESADEAGRAGGPLNAIGGIAAGVATGGIAILVGALVTVGATLAGITTAGLKWATEFASGMKMVEAQTGIAGESLDSFRGSAQEVFQAGLGESFADVAQAMTQVHQITGATGEEMEKMTAQAMTLSEVFGVDVGESLRGVDQAMIAFGEDGAAVFDMLTATMQATGDPMDDLADTINEYSGNFAEAGFSAEEMFGVLNAGLEAGAWNFDKVGDTVREFFIRLQDGSDTTQDALSELFGISDEAQALQTSIDELSGAIEWQEQALILTQAALDDVNSAWGEAQAVVNDLESALGEARRELDNLSRPNLAGMQEFDDQIFNLEQSIKQARLAMLDMEEDTPEFEAAEAELAGLNRELDKTRLAQDIQYDAQFRALEIAAADSTKEVVTFDEAMADIVAKQDEVAGLEGALWDAQAAEAAAAADAKVLQSAYDAIAGELLNNKDRLAEVQAALEGLDSPAREFLDAFAEGAITGPEAMSQIIQALQDVEDPLERNKMGVDLFGSMWEDLGENVILAMDPAQVALQDFEGATGRAQEATERGLGPAFDRLKRTLKVAVGEGFAPVLAMLVESITPAFETFADWLKGDGRAVMERFGQFLTDNLAPALENLGPLIEEKIVPALEKFAGWMVEEGIPAIQDLINWIVNDGIPAFLDLAKFITTKVVPAFKTMGKGIKPFIDGLKMIGKVLDWFFRLFDKTLKAIGKLFHRWFGNSELLDSVFEFGQNLVRTFISFLAGVISELIVWGQELLKKLGTILGDWLKAIGTWGRDFIRDVGVILGDTVSAVITWGTNLIRELGTILGNWLKAILDWGRDFLRDVGLILGNIISAVITWGTNLIRELGVILGNWLSAILDWGRDFIRDVGVILGNIVSAVITWGTNLIRELGTILGNWLQTVSNWGQDFIRDVGVILGNIVSDVITWGTNLIRELGTILSNWLSAVTAWGTDFIRDLGTILGNAVSAVITWGTDFIRELGTILSNWLSAVITWGTDFIRDLGTILGNAVSAVISWGTDMLREFGLVLQSIIDAITGWAGTLHDAFRTALEGLAAIPGQIADLLSQIGIDIINFVIAGIQAVGTFVDDVVAQLASWFNDVYLDILGGFQAATDVGRLIVNTIVTGFQNVTTFVGNIVDELAGWVGEVASNAGSIAEDIINTAATLGSNIVDWISTGISNATSAIVDALVGLINWAIQQIFPGAPEWNPRLREIGGSLVDSMAQGVYERANLLSDALAWSVSNAMGAAQGGGAFQLDTSFAAGSLDGGPGTTDGGGGLGGKTVNLGGQAFNVTINDDMDMDEFIFKVQYALQQLGTT